VERARVREKLLGKDLDSALKQIARKLERIRENIAEADAKRIARPSDRGWHWVLEARIARRAVSLREALFEAGAVYLPERLHLVRIAVKKLRYALELSIEAANGRVTPELRVLKRAQELLGRINDLDVLMKRIRRVQASLDPPNIAAWRELDVLTTSIENSCRRLHGRYMRERPALEAVTEQLSARGARPSARAAGAASRRALRHGSAQAAS
jgi:CHAD domain-containing protein